MPSVREFGAVGDGTTDDTQAVQRAVDEASRLGEPLVVPEGVYNCTQSVLLPSGLDVELAAGAVLQKDFSSNGGTTGSFLRNAGFEQKLQDISITGPGVIRARALEQTGNILALYADRVTLSGFTIDRFAGGRAIVAAGDDWRADGLVVTGSPVESGVGAYRVVGGRGQRWSRCHGESGDDTFQFVPSQARNDPLFDLSIEDCSFEDCTGTSTNGRLIVAGLGGPRGEVGAEIQQASVVDCAFRRITGAGSQASTVTVLQNTSSGTISNLLIEDVDLDVVDVGGDHPGLAASIFITAQAGGGIDGLVLRNVEVRGQPPGQRALLVRGRCRGTRLEDVRLSRSAAANVPVAVLGGEGTEVVGGRLDGGGATGSPVVLVGNVGGGATDPVGTLLGGGLDIVGIGDGVPGIRVGTGKETDIRGVRFVGERSSVGVSVGPQSSGTRLTDVDPTGVGRERVGG